MFIPEHFDPLDVETLVEVIEAKLMDDQEIIDALKICNLHPTTRAARMAAEVCVTVILAHELGTTVLEEFDQVMAILPSIDPWDRSLPGHEMKCKFCDYIPPYGPLIDPEDEAQWHKPDCLWLLAYQEKGAQDEK